MIKTAAVTADVMGVVTWEWHNGLGYKKRGMVYTLVFLWLNFSIIQKKRYINNDYNRVS